MRLVIRRTKSLIHEFYARGITLDEIAEKLNVTPEYLGSQFHKEVGVTFSTYMKEYRIQKAKKLLIGTNLKLYEVAEQVGYACLLYTSQRGFFPLRRQPGYGRNQSPVRILQV